MANDSANPLGGPPLGGAQVQEGGVSLGELLEVVRSGLGTIAITVLVFFLLGLFYVITVPPGYKADGLVQVEENEKNGSMTSLNDISSLLLGSPVETEAEIRILQSRLVLDQVIDKMNLLIVASPQRFPIIGSVIARANRDLATPAAAPLGLSRYGWGGEAIKVATFEVPDKYLEEKYKLLTTEQGYRLFDPDGAEVLSGSVGVEASGGKGRGAVKILVQELRARPGTAFNIVRMTRQQVLKDLSGALTVAEEGKQSGVIGIKFGGRSPQFVAQVVDNIEDFYLKQNIERRSADAEQSLRFLERQLPELKNKVDDAQAALNLYQVNHGSVDVTQETELVLQQSVDLETKRLELIQQRDQAEQRFTANHPVVLALNQQIASIATAQAEAATREQKLPKTQQAVFSLQRDLDVATQLYTQLLDTIQQLEVAKAGTIGNVRVVDYALEPSKPKPPGPVLSVLIAMFLGGIFGVLLVFARQSLVRGVDDPAEIELRLGLTNYASIPFVQEQRRVTRAMARGDKGLTFILAALDSKNPAIEAIRSLRTSLHFALLESANNIVMLTGPSPSLGKSFLSINLGAVLAASNKRVVVIDADLRRGTLHRYTGGDAAPGLADYVAGDIDRQTVVRTSEIAGLDYVTHGTIPPNPAELLLHERFGELMTSLSKEYDYVIIDAPPILAVTDPAIIGRIAGCTMLVLKSAHHSLREIEESVRRLSNGGVKVRGVLFNQVGAVAGSYGYGKYGYNYYRYDGK